jgi:lipid II isoglutaminyl synthase (glutamine-hydrolysing)
MTTLRLGRRRGTTRRPAAPRPRLTWRLRVARRLAVVAENASRVLGTGAGGVIGGRLILALAPDAARQLSSGRDVLLVSGTNGKTTTTSHLVAGLATDRPVVGNADGANTPPGLVRALASGQGTAVLETDEGWLPWAVTQTPPVLVVLLNLSRDQLHRHHEVAALAATWHEALKTVDHVVANADDPDVVHPALAARRQTWVALGVRWTEDSTVCPRCGGACRRVGVHWGCDGCGLRRPEPDWWLEGDDLVSATSRVRLKPALPGHANLANAAVAVAAATAMGVPPHRTASAVAEIDAVAGRYDVIDHEGRQVRLLLAKNPASWVEALEIASTRDSPLVLAFNSDGVDGRDPSWLYDVPFGVLAGRSVVVTGRRSTDLLVRLEMEGLRGVRVADGVTSALRALPPGPVDLVANYTAFQEARRELSHGA